MPLMIAGIVLGLGMPATHACLSVRPVACMRRAWEL
jgi:hypothetical protein